MKHRFVAVRFGNVLGSNGSVIPLFKKQIAHGGPVTLTNKYITRFFMTIPEAAQLVLQAGAYAEGGEIFVLDMGKPVKIYDLAWDLIKLSGFEPNKDIKIEITGLRPGEKLYEELLMSEEGLTNTKHEKIFIGRPTFSDLGEIQERMKELAEIIEKDDVELLINKIEEIVPTYNRSMAESAITDDSRVIKKCFRGDIMGRFFDVIISLLLLVLLSPLFLIIGIIIKLNSKGPVFFTQMRIGKNNELFKFYKFRTMKIGTPNVATDKLDSSKSYITTIGKILRKTSLDELPQLINILKGDMTFVGPRPALYNQYELKEMRTKAGVHTLLPGVTGWAQINGRDNNNDYEKTEHDRYYLNNKSLWLDIKIVFRTVFKVLKAEGIVDARQIKKS